MTQIFTWMKLLSWLVCEAAALVKCELNLRCAAREGVSWLLQPPPGTHAASCHPPFQVLYYGSQARAGSWVTLVTPAPVNYGQDSWIPRPHTGAEGGPKSSPLITDRSRTCGFQKQALQDLMFFIPKPRSS